MQINSTLLQSTISRKSSCIQWKPPRNQKVANFGARTPESSLVLNWRIMGVHQVTNSNLNSPVLGSNLRPSEKRPDQEEEEHGQHLVIPWSSRNDERRKRCRDMVRSPIRVQPIERQRRERRAQSPQVATKQVKPVFSSSSSPRLLLSSPLLRCPLCCGANLSSCGDHNYYYRPTDRSTTSTRKVFTSLPGEVVFARSYSTSY